MNTRTHAYSFLLVAYVVIALVIGGNADNLLVRRVATRTPATYTQQLAIQAVVPYTFRDPRDTPIEILARYVGDVFPDSTVVEELADGISYHRILTPDNQVVNVIMIDIRRGGRITSYKALERNDGLETACDIAARASVAIDDTVLAACNASFWRAGTNTPIGVTISQGEVLEMPGYKHWSSLLVYEDGTASIDRITLHGNVGWRGRSASVVNVNRRASDDRGVVVYNNYYGDSLPRGSRRSDSAIVADALDNRVSTASGDYTESDVDTADLIREYREEIVREDREHPNLKIVCRFPAPRRRRDPAPGPVVGEPMKLVVMQVDTGVVSVPEDGFVISAGESPQFFDGIVRGDTISLAYTISPRPNARVRDVITATPRLVRNGSAEPEHNTEGSKAKRFVRHELARTAVGISRSGDTLLLVTVDSPERGDGRRGMTLTQLAVLMRSLGAWDAMNCDGGGSASMAVDGTTISRQGSGLSHRRVSNALVVVKRALSRREIRANRRRNVPAPTDTSDATGYNSNPPNTSSVPVETEGRWP